MGSPTGVRDTGMGVKGLGHVESSLVDQLPQLGNLADLLEGKNLILLVAIDGKAGRIVATVLETRQPCRTKKPRLASKFSSMQRADWELGDKCIQG